MNVMTQGGSVEERYGFLYREVVSKLSKEEQRAHKCTIDFNAIFFNLQGKIAVSWNEFEDVVIGPGEMYFLPRGAYVSAYIVGDSISYIVARLEHNLTNDIAYNELSELKKSSQLDEYKFQPLKMNKQLLRFSHSIRNYLINGINIPQLHAIKLSELQIILRRYYTVMECANLFFPIVNSNWDFEQFVLNNYLNVESIDELAERANMSRSTFNRKFKDTFGVTPLKWVDAQTRHTIINKAAEPNVSVKDIMYEVGIFNPSQFTQLCKRLVGVTPSELIRFK